MHAPTPYIYTHTHLISSCTQYQRNKVQLDQLENKNKTPKQKERDQLMVQKVTKDSMGKVMESDHGGVLEEEMVVGERLEEEEDDDDELVLPGFRFHPTDEELVTFYLRRKVAGKRLSIEIIKEIDIYKHEPSDLPKANTVCGDKEWYFFCLRGRKYRNSVRPNRVTGAGFWKATGIDRPVRSAGGRGGCIGLKKSLVYYRGSAGKGTKTEWMMHEFRLPPRPDAAVHSSPCFQEAEVWTICRIFKRSITYKKQPQQQQQAVAAAFAAAPQPVPDSSSVTTGSCLESDCTGDNDEYYMADRLQAAAPAVNNVHNNGGYGGQSFQGQWINSTEMQPAASSTAPAMAAFHPSVPGLAPPLSPPNDGCWDDIGRMVMELTDPSVFYDCIYDC